MNKILTISIAAYNVEKYINEALDSIVNSSNISEIEVLVINDGGTDNTEKITREYQKKYPDSVKLINKENGGWGSTVNKGIELATGKYFKLLDGDDYLINVDEYVNALRDCDSDLVYNEYNIFYENSDKIDYFKIKENAPKNKKVELKAEYIPEKVPMPACTFKTDILKNRFLITEKCYYTDVEFVLKSIKMTKTITFIPLNVYCYRRGLKEQSVNINGFRNHYKEHLQVLIGLLELYKETEKNSEINRIFFNRLSDMVGAQYYFFLILKPTKEHRIEMKKFDDLIKSNYPDFYKTKRRRVKLFRTLGSWTYYFIVYKQ